ncbi:MAG TPA: hypothetical protein VIW94_08245 [Acidimicrobiia bacterium]
MITDNRTVRLAGRDVAVIFPSRSDARLHTSAVIVTVHIIGIFALGFAVSVPQVAAAILTAGLIDLGMTFRSSGKLVWPASGILTGSGVALILRITGMEGRDYWKVSGWQWFALVAGISILTKYLIRYRGRHIFNPSNVGLVAAFLIIGARFIEPLDFWWAPIGFWMLTAYVVIIGGGITITRRLDLLTMAVTFWVFLAGGLGVLAASGHCMIATWAPSPVCGPRFWTTLVTSPEVMIFLFFMITDPKTIPSGRRARVVFAASLAMASTLLIAPQTLEYGAKVGLLGSLVIWSPLRGLFDRLVTDETADGRPGWDSARPDQPTSVGTFARGLAIGSGIVLLIVAIVLAGTPTRNGVEAGTPIAAVPVVIDPSQLPEVRVEPSATGVNVDMDAEFAADVAVMLAENLALESEALRIADGVLLGLADAGERLDEMQARLATAVATGERRVDVYRFDSLTLSVHEGEAQTSAGLLFEGRGSVDVVIYDTSGQEVSRSASPFDKSFVLRQVGGERWIIVEVDP